MIKRYEKFLEKFDQKLETYFSLHKDLIKCKKGCAACCEVGEYPFSRLESEYIMFGFQTLPQKLRTLVKNNISELKKIKLEQNGKRFDYRCPFLVEKTCVLYKYRGLVCRTFGLAYVADGVVKLPECANFGLNYSEIFDPETSEITLSNPIEEDLRIDKIFQSDLAKGYELEHGKIRRLIDWFTTPFDSD